MLLIYLNNMEISLYTLNQLRLDKEIWKNLEIIPVKCNFCNLEFEIKYGTLYNIIRRNADGVYCSRKCAASARVISTQDRFKQAGGKLCKRCGEFRSLENFSSLPNPPYYRAECKRCHNYKPARQYSACKEKAHRMNIYFDLSLNQFLKFQEQNCYYCNIDIKNIRLEMLNMEYGYSENNVVACCHNCQKFKNGLNHQDFIQLCYTICKNIKYNGEKI